MDLQNLPVPGSGVVGGWGVVVRPPIYNEVGLVVGAEVVVVVVVFDARRRLEIRFFGAFVVFSIEVSSEILFWFDDDPWRLLDRDGFLGRLGRPTSFFPVLQFEKFFN